MASSFKLPDLGEGLTEGEVARWLVVEGQEIAEDDPLVEIQTDKATVEIPSPYGGTVLKILVAEGEIVPVGTELVLIGAPARRFRHWSPRRRLTERAEPHRRRLPWRASRRHAVVRRIAQELGIDLAAVTATGPGGRVTEDDVRARGRRRRGTPRASARSPPRDRRAHGARPP